MHQPLKRKRMISPNSTDQPCKRTRTTSANSIEQQKEENGNTEKYMDIITGDLAYDPVRLPNDQDLTQAIFNRKTLDTIWETTHHPRNPFTRQWFHIKSVIPQVNLRAQMQQQLEHNEFSADGAEFDVIAEYTKIVEKEQMKQHLSMLRDDVSNSLGLQKEYWEKMWKKINLLRLYCQYHDENIQTFRDLKGFRYLHKLNIQTNALLKDDTQEQMEINEAVLDVCKEIVRAVDVIGLRSSDVVGINSMGGAVFRGLLNILLTAHCSSKGYLKFQSIVLRLLCQLSDESNVRFNPLGHRRLTALASKPANDKLSRSPATDISSEDLNHGISILRKARNLKLDINVDEISYVKVIVNAVIICIARTLQIPDKCDLSELQLLETKEQERHNLEALEKGLLVINGMLNERGPVADTIEDLDIVSDIERVLKHLTECPRGCNTSHSLHNRIEVLALKISGTVSKRRR